MQNFAHERLILAVSAVEMASMAFEAALAYSREREAFGKPLAAFQVTRHKLAEMATGIDVCRTYNYALAARILAGDRPIREVAMAKNAATDMASRVIDQAVQIYGGAGYMRGALVERLYRDIRLYPIGGGTREVMNEIISKTL
jgi:acyl-CoA dehydrogenase